MAQLKSVNQIFFVVVFMSKGFSSTEFDLSVKINYPESSCYCQNQSNQLIENYRSILDRKQSNISSWKILEENGQMCFIRGTRSCQTTDALVIRFDHICLIHPWYKDINLNDEILTSFPRKQISSVLEVVLLEDNHSSSKYQLAIIECPCVERYGTFCTFCRCTLSATEPTKLNDQEEKLESSIVPILSNDKNDNALQLISRETQTKLYAILLPPSPLSEMRKATIEMTFDDKITRACQTNTLFYLMKTKTTSMQKPLTVEHRPMINKNDYLSVNSLSHMDIESIRNDRQDQNKMKLMVDNFDIIRPPPKCINLCEKVDFDRSQVNVSMNALQTNVSITTSRSNNHLEPSPNCLQNERRVKSSVIKTEEIKVDPMKSQTLSSSSSFIITIDRDHQNDQSIIPTLLNAHLLFATATKHTSVSEHIQTLSTNDKTSVDELINYQISLATQENYRSVSIVIDDIKSLEKHRENFLHSFYNTLFTTFRRTLEDQSIKLTCMNLIYFNHSFYDRLTMQRLRLIDTGNKNRESEDVIVRTSA